MTPPIPIIEEASPEELKAYIYAPLASDVLQAIEGNASSRAKTAVVRWLELFSSRPKSFAYTVGDRIRIVEVSANAKKDEEKKREGRVVCVLDVRDDMVNAAGNLHGGCAMYLLDVCSSLAVTALSVSQNQPSGPGVSQSIHTVFHSPAPLGSKLKIVNTTLAIGSRVMSAQCEIWDETQHRLVASGVQTKMQASLDPRVAKL